MNGKMFGEATRIELGRPCPPDQDPRVKIDPASGEPYLPACRVIDSLNAIFGPGQWSTTFREIKILHSGEVAMWDRREKKEVVRALVVAQAVCTLTVRDEDGREVTHEDVGVAQSYQAPPIPPFELALKSATSDAMKRAARKLGTFLGNSLYDKDDKSGAGFAGLESRVGDPPTADPRTQAPAQAPREAAPARTQAPAPAASPASSQGAPRPSSPAPRSFPPPVEERPDVKRELDLALSDYWKAAGDLPACATAAGIYSPDDLVGLSDEQAAALLDQVKKALAGLGRK